MTGFVGRRILGQVGIEVWVGPFGDTIFRGRAVTGLTRDTLISMPLSRAGFTKLSLVSATGVDRIRDRSTSSSRTR